ncbi:MAG: lysophospholipid acyltransferase family protein [Planctomycetota bacterium]|nr:lysophospholipid acyltransferase family protein [Planctomycetota bacterium]
MQSRANGIDARRAKPGTHQSLRATLPLKMPTPSAAQPFAPPITSEALPRPASQTPAWLGPFFELAQNCPPIARALKPAACALAPLVAPAAARAISKNALRIFGRELAPAEQLQFTRRVFASFYEFILDLGRATSMTPCQIAAQVGHVEGLEAYRAARARRRGAVLVTAHLGTFEAGLAALVREERTVRVVFKRDSVGEFEQMRSRLHHLLGVIETPIDDGIDTWLGLRDALLRDEVIVMQGDRAMPGQKSQVLPFLHGHLRLPTGPARLAQLTGAPIIPVFAIKDAPHQPVKVLLKQPIEPDTPDTPAANSAMNGLADALAQTIAHHAHQWLALEPMFHEDRPDATQ